MQVDQNSNFSTRSILCVPLQTKGQTIGAIEAINKGIGTFNQEDLRLLTSLVAPAATAIDNARLFERAQQEIAERQRAEAALEKERALLARRVAERTADLSAANTELARAARLKDEFLASMSHELRTPLTAILGLSDVLKLEVYGSLTEKQHKSVQGIEESGRHLLDLINDILDLSKIEADKLELEIGPVSAQAVCQASLQFIKQTANKKQLKVFSTYDETVTTLMADERRLKQILVNLLSNAVKFTPEGGKIGLEVLGHSARQMIDFVVWDTGIGITPENIDRLFQPFVQLDSSLARQFAGTGLGLALVHRMVEMHGGGISVESEVDKGSRFTISLPLSELPQAEETDETEQAEPDISTIERALIIEDSPTTINQLTRYLKRLGTEVVAHPRGEDAVDKVLETQPEVIILDILLPDSSGWDVLAQLKAEPRTEHIPVLILSVLDEPSQGLALGAAEYLVKPITQQQLVEALKRILSARAESAEQSNLTMESDGEKRADSAVAALDSPLILLAEDQDKVSEFVVDYLVERKRYRVIATRNGLEALERARAEKPDLILMDIQMPKMDGVEATRQLRADANLATVPIIALTALAMPGDRERCLEAGADAYLSKPISLQELGTVIDIHLSDR
jgi:signal transduction histidine kinase/DNA-binding response OmpR family regulator